MKISVFHRIGILVLMVAAVTLSSCTKTYHITVKAEDSSMGSVFGTGDYEPNSEVEIGALPHSSYVFARWKDGNTDNPRKIRVSSDLTFIAVFEKDDGEEPPVTYETGTVTDCEGREYPTVLIGNLWWMAEDLAVKKDVDGQIISNDGTLQSHTTPLCYTSPQENVLYNWAAAVSVCPEGWHLPSSEEWSAMEQALGAVSQHCYEGDPSKIAKALAVRNQWKSSIVPGTPGYYQMYNNTSGFAAVPVGKFASDFTDRSYTANFWTSDAFNDSIAYNRTISYDKATVNQMANKKNVGLSVRCISVARARTK